MNRVKPNQTPVRPYTLGAYSRNAEDMAPTSIFSAQNYQQLCTVQKNDHKKNLNKYVIRLPSKQQHKGNPKHHNAGHQR